MNIRSVPLRDSFKMPLNPFWCHFAIPFLLARIINMCINKQHSIWIKYLSIYIRICGFNPITNNFSFSIHPCTHKKTNHRIMTLHKKIFSSLGLHNNFFFYINRSFIRILYVVVQKWCVTATTMMTTIVFECACGCVCGALQQQQQPHHRTYRKCQSAVIVEILYNNNYTELRPKCLPMLMMMMMQMRMMMERINSRRIKGCFV